MDQTRDLRRFDGRPGFADDAGAGEKLRRSEDRRTIDVIAVQRDLGVPVKLSGLGEGADDLAPFEPAAFVEALLG